MGVLDLFRLDGKTAIVTGGGRGLGASIAETYAEVGANVVICSRKLEPCEKMRDYLKQEYGIEALAFSCDVVDQDDVKRVVKETMAHFGGIDILVNNSGATWGASVLDMPFEAWNKVINVNITGTFLMTQEVGKHMIEAGQGKIINMASIAGYGGTNPEYMDTIGYNTSKGAVMTFTKDLATKWGKHNIHVNAIAPGFIPTKMSQGLIEMGGERIVEETPLNRLGNDDDIKGAALFLASFASDFVSGIVLSVDGGASAY